MLSNLVSARNTITTIGHTVTVIDRESGFYESKNFVNSWLILNFKNAHWIYFEISTLKNTMTLLYSHRSTQQRQVRLKSVLFGVRIRNSPLFPFNSCFNTVHSLNVLQQTQVQMNDDQISGPVFSKPVSLLVVYEVISRPVSLSSKNVITGPPIHIV